MVDNIFGISSAALAGAGSVLQAIYNGIVAVFESIVGIF